METAPNNKTAHTPQNTVFQAAKRVNHLVDHFCTHERKRQRGKVSLDTEIRLLMDDGTVYDHGHAKLRDLSRTGARLTNILLPGDSLPAAPFQIEIVIRSGNYVGLGLRAKPVRFAQSERGVGVTFIGIFTASE